MVLFARRARHPRYLVSAPLDPLMEERAHLLAQALPMSQHSVALLFKLLSNAADLLSGTERALIPK